MYKEAIIIGLTASYKFDFAIIGFIVGLITSSASAIWIISAWKAKLELEIATNTKLINETRKISRTHFREIRAEIREVQNYLIKTDLEPPFEIPKSDYRDFSDFS